MIIKIERMEHATNHGQSDNQSNHGSRRVQIIINTRSWADSSR